MADEISEVKAWTGVVRPTASVSERVAEASTTWTPLLVVETMSSEADWIEETSPPLYALMAVSRAVTLSVMELMTLLIEAISRSTGVGSREPTVGVAMAPRARPRVRMANCIMRFAGL